MGSPARGAPPGGRYNTIMRFVGERKALAAMVLAFYGLLYLLNGLLGPPPFMAMFLGLSLCYLTGFFGLVAGYFWARWFTLGLAFSGLGVAGLMLWQIGLDPVVIFWGVTHGVVALSLLGDGPASAFDGRADWRERWKMDESSAQRLGKSITRAGASLPYLIVAGLAPRQDSLALVALLVGVAGIWALLRMRAWSVFALATSAVLALVGSVQVAPFAVLGVYAPLLGADLVAGILLLLAAAPFAPAVVRYLRR